MITSPRNPRIAQAAGLKKRASRDEAQQFLVEGAQAISEALGSGVMLATLFTTDLSHEVAVTAEAAGVVVEEVSASVMERLASTVNPQGLVAVAPYLDVALDQLPSDLRGVAILATCQDPGNAGTVVRSADSSGADTVIFTDGSVDAYNPKTVRATAGSLFHLPVVRDASTAEAVATVKERGCRVLAASADGAESLFDVDLRGPVAFLFGNESWGLAPEHAALADASVRIPLSPRSESLNLASAAAVCLFEWRRQQDHAPEQPGTAAATATAPGPRLEVVIAAAAHDLRSPAAGVKSFAATLLHSTAIDEETRHMLLEGIAYDAERMHVVVQQLIEAARLASGTIEPFAEPADVRALVEDLASILAGSPGHPEVLWEGGDLDTTLDRGRLRLALAACVEAQVWFATTGPIHVTGALVDESLVRLTVAREGTELSADDLAALFAPPAAGSGGGSKLGLFVAHGALAGLGGSLTARVDDGRLVFVLEMPVVKPPRGPLLDSLPDEPSPGTPNP